MLFHSGVVRKVGFEAGSWRKWWKGSDSWRVCPIFWGWPWLKGWFGRRGFDGRAVHRGIHGGAMVMESMGYGYIKEGWNCLFLGGLGERGCFRGKSCYGHMLGHHKKAYMLY